MRTGFDFEQWSIEAVAGRWRGDQEGRTYEVEIGARRAEGRWRDGYMEVDYDSATVSFQDVELHSARARYVEVEESMYFSGGVSGTDSLRRFTAVALNYALADQRVEAKGDVVWHEGEIELRAEYLVQDRVAREVEARGEKAFFARHGRSLAAAQLIYSSVPEQVLATGQVVYLEGERRLEVEQLLYRVSEERLEADGTAVLQVPEFSGAATAGELVFDLATEELVLREEPQLNLQRDQPLHMRAAQLRFDLGGRVLVGEPEFHLATGDLVLEAERGVYEDADERLVLVGAVKLRQERVEEAYKSHLRADSMVVKLRHGQVVQVALEGSVKADMHSADIQADWMEGERGQIFFEDQRLERIELEGAADATHQHLERGSVSRFKGERMELFFAAGTLERVEVVGRAEVVSRPPEEDGEEEFTPSHFRGEQLEIALEDGEVTRVDIVKPEGDIYAPQSEE